MQNRTPRPRVPPPSPYDGRHIVGRDLLVHVIKGEDRTRDDVLVYTTCKQCQLVNPHVGMRLTKAPISCLRCLVGGEEEPDF